MRDATPQTIKLGDYTPPAFLVSAVALEDDVAEGAATVRSTLRLERNAAHPKADAPLVLDGEDLELLGIEIDGRALPAGEYRMLASFDISEIEEEALDEARSGTVRAEASRMVTIDLPLWSAP